MFIPQGFIEGRCQQDRFNSDVSLIHMCDGKTFRMVHHTPEVGNYQKATIYAGPGKFIRVKCLIPTNPCVATSIEIAGYRVSWGDGDNLGTTTEPDFPEIECLGHIQECNFDLVIVNVLTAIEYIDGLWEHKYQNRVA